MAPEDIALVPKPLDPAAILSPAQQASDVLDRQDEARNLCRSLIQAERTVSYDQVRLAAQRLGLAVSRPMFAAIHRDLAGTVRGSDVPVVDPATSDLLPSPSPEAQAPAPNPALVEMRRRTSAMDFMVEHLTSHPEATYEEVQAAAEAEGHAVWPVTYGRARQLAGLPTRGCSRRSSRRRQGPKSPGPRRATDPQAMGAGPASGSDAPASVETVPAEPPRRESTAMESPATTTGSAALEFVVAYLRSRPWTSFEKLQDVADQAGHVVFPATYERARQVAGLSPGRAPRRRRGSQSGGPGDTATGGDGERPASSGSPEPAVVPDFAPPAPSTTSKPTRVSARRALRDSVRFVAKYLRTRPDASFRKIREAGSVAGLNIYPLIVGLGHQRLARREALAAERTALPPEPTSTPAPAPATRKPRPTAKLTAVRSTALAPAPASSASSDVDRVLTDLVGLVERLERQRAEMREAIARIREIARECLDRTV